MERNWSLHQAPGVPAQPRLIGNSPQRDLKLCLGSLRLMLCLRRMHRDPVGKRNKPPDATENLGVAAADDAGSVDAPGQFADRDLDLAGADDILLVNRVTLAKLLQKPRGCGCHRPR